MDEWIKPSKHIVCNIYDKQMLIEKGIFIMNEVASKNMIER